MKLHETADDDANAAAAVACLPRDVLGNVFLRLPASDLRRFRRVCKEWRAVISDPVFVNEHMDHGPWGLTHTIVFLPGRSGGGAEAEHGHGFLFDEHWRLVATFTAGESEEMVGTCNGLLCFLDVPHGAINVVEPFTGESLALPMPPRTDRSHERGAYCLGFDPSSRRYKIFHQGLDFHTENTTAQDVYVYTVGQGENWRRVDVAGAAESGASYRDPVLADGSMYWSVETADQHVKLVRFDLATEEVTSESMMDFLRAGDWQTAFHVMTDSGARKCVTVGPFGDLGVYLMGEGGRWTANSCSGMKLPQQRCLALPQALQRGCLLLQDNGGMYVHPIPPAGDDLGLGKLLLKIGKEKDKEPAKSSTRGLFIAALLNQVPAMEGRLPKESTFCYAPPVSPAPLARRCGFPCGSPPQTLAENKVASRS